jgi:hypothetical protein
MKKSKILALFFCTLLFFSCELNKSVVLIPEKPFEYYENNIKFVIHENQNWWITFQAPHVKHNAKTIIPFFVSVRTNEKIEQVYLKSITLFIEELDIEIKKENILLPIDNIHDKLSEPEYDFIGSLNLWENNLLKTEEIQNSFSTKITLDELYKEFRNVKKVEFHTVIIYNIDGENKESILKWTYKAIRETTLAFWDTMMSV